MTIVVDVVDDTGLVAGHDAVRGLLEAVLEAEGVSGEVAVAFVDEPLYRRPEQPLPGGRGTHGRAGLRLRSGGGVARRQHEGAAASGEIVVCPQVVMRYAAEEGREATVQLGWTLIHGALHLAGYDHETDDGEMREREQELLRRLGERVQALALTR